MRWIGFFVIILWYQAVNAQLLNGLWKGNGMAGDEEAYIELKLEHKGSLLTGESLLLFKNNRFQRFKIDGIYHPGDSSLGLKEIKLLEFKKGFFDVNCFSHYSLVVSRTADGYQLSGSGYCKTKGLMKLKSETVQYSFTRNDTTIQLVGIESAGVDTLVSIPEMAKSRAEHTVKTFVIDQEPLRVTLYDNGEIDGDTVSLLFNEQVIADRIRLNEKPAEFELKINKERRINKLLFIAHNLGTIPPNTGTLSVVIDGKIHRLFLSADLGKNAAIEFIWESDR